MYSGNCGSYCEPQEWSKKDREVFLKEKQAILEAKLATVKHMLENLDDEEEEEAEKK
jgi:hypothetical protein